MIGARAITHRHRHRPATAGFTLVEVMVSLLIFGMLAAAGVALLSFSARAQSATGARLDDIAALNRTVAALSGDCAQALDRAARDEGGTLLPAFVGDHGSGTPMLRLVRGGWSNLDGAARPEAQKVEYRIEDGALVRVAYPQLDGAAPLPSAVLLGHVRQVRLRYRYAGAWTDHWDGAGGVPLPQALELNVVRDDGTAFRQLFLVGTGYAPLAEGAANATS